MNAADWQVLQAGFGTLAAALGKRQRDKRNDELANSLVNRQSDGLRAQPVNGIDPGYAGAVNIDATTEADDQVMRTPFSGGLEGLRIQEALVTKSLREAQIKKALQPPALRATAASGGRSSGGYVPPPTDPPAPNMVWNGHDRFIKVGSAQGTATTSGADKYGDSLDKLSRDVVKKYGIGIDDLPDPQGVAAGNVDKDTGAWTPATDGTHWRFTTPKGDVVTKPKDEIAPYLRRFRRLHPDAPLSPAEQGGAPQPLVPTAPAVTSQGTVKVQKPDGTTGIIPAENLKKALSKGWKQID